MRSKESKLPLELFLVTVLLLFCEFVFFRNVLGKDGLFGDRGDGRLTMLLTEHWWNFFTGQEKFGELSMFYPAQGIIGYTDLFLGYGILFSVLRLFGLNMFYAYKWTLILVHMMGTASMYYLLRRKLRCAIGWSLFGTLAFCFSDTYARHLGHTQLNAISALPLLLILFIGFVEHYDVQKKRNLYAYGFLTWFILLSYNSWYIACFSGIFCLVFIIVFGIRLKMRKVKVVSVFFQTIQPILKDICGYLIYTVLLYIPFISIYLPAMRTTSGYGYQDCAYFLPEFIDIINVSESNLLMGPIISKLMLSSRGYSSEIEEGFSFVLLSLFVILCYVSCKKSKNDKHTNRYYQLLPTSIFFSVIICLALIIRLSSNGVSLWIFVYYLLPVARSIRAIARFMLWLSFPMAVVTAYAADRCIKSKSFVLSLVAIILIFTSNINRFGISSAWDFLGEDAFLSNVSAPPEDADVFYIIDSAKAGDPPYIYQLDAVEIAEKYHIKTINGYSGKFPDGWWTLWDVTSEDYEVCVADWINRHQLENVYAYDRATGTWIEHVPPKMSSNYPAAWDASDSAGRDTKFTSGLWDPETGFSWTKGECQIALRDEVISQKGLEISYDVPQQTAQCYGGSTVTVEVNNVVISEKTYLQGVSETLAFLPESLPTAQDGIYNIEITCSKTFNPKAMGISEDSRDLGIQLKYVGGGR